HIIVVGLISAFYRQHGRIKTALRDNRPRLRVIPKKYGHLTFVKRGDECFMAVGDTFLTGIDFI
ncbi:hypothetical protein, partial [Klebsiella michiganensis]|uniref:hypothetical protein n=1 Tax=Klebsiella michiganensis TaxID=1134687 RepID=UPI003887A04E